LGGLQSILDSLSKEEIIKRLGWTHPLKNLKKSWTSKVDGRAKISIDFVLFRFDLKLSENTGWSKKKLKLKVIDYYHTSAANTKC